jgi:type IV pilus assembly protein PilW
MKKKFAYTLKASSLKGRLKGGSIGFTLVEMLVALLIVSIISGTAYSIFLSLSRSYTTQSVASAMQQRVRAAINYMIWDIRMAGLDPRGTAGAGIISATATTLQFTADKNLDGDVNDAGENITYNVTGRSLKLTDDQGTEVLTDNVSNFSFVYFDQNGAVTTTASDVRLVEIVMTLQEPAGGGKLVSRICNIRVRCRNIGL